MAVFWDDGPKVGIGLIWGLSYYLPVIVVIVVIMAFSPVSPLSPVKITSISPCDDNIFLDPAAPATTMYPEMTDRDRPAGSGGSGGGRGDRHGRRWGPCIGGNGVSCPRGMWAGGGGQGGGHCPRPSGGPRATRPEGGGVGGLGARAGGARGCPAGGGGGGGPAAWALALPPAVRRSPAIPAEKGRVCCRWVIALD